MERDAVKNESTAQLKDITAGSLAGVFAKMIEYPLDTLKVLMQVSEQKGKGNLRVGNVFWGAFNHGGFKRIYRGLSAPIIGAAVENLITFWMFGFLERKLKKKLRLRELSMLQIAACGAFSGIGTGLWLTPVEFIKCQMQVSHTAAKYNNSMAQCLKHNLLLKPSNLMIGLSATMIREVPGSLVYFVSYRGSVRFLNKKFNSNENGKLWIILTSGGIAGITCWASVYPIDLIKSNQQSLNVVNIDSKYQIKRFETHGDGSLLMAAKMKQERIRTQPILKLLMDRIRKNGFRSLYAGFSVAATRAVISNAIIFAGYEYSRKMLDTVIIDEIQHFD